MEKEDDHKSNVFWLVLGNTINMEIYTEIIVCDD